MQRKVITRSVTRRVITLNHTTHTSSISWDQLQILILPASKHRYCPTRGQLFHEQLQPGIIGLSDFKCAIHTLEVISKLSIQAFAHHLYVHFQQHFLHLVRNVHKVVDSKADSHRHDEKGKEELKYLIYHLISQQGELSQEKSHRWISVIFFLGLLNCLVHTSSFRRPQLSRKRKVKVSSIVIIHPQYSFT